MFHIASEEEIKTGKVSDVYFSRTMEVLKSRGVDKQVVAEVWTKGFPHDWEWGVLAGVEECIELLKGRPLNLRGLREGSIFRAFEPVLEIEGHYLDFALLETALLGFFCQSSGVATAAARCKKAAGDRQVMSFGARRMHPAIAPMIERSAFIGGCDGVAVVKSAEFIAEQPAGTMPHALILVMGDTVEATRAFYEVVSKKVPVVSLIDTFHDEKFAALEVAEALGKNLSAVRLDTPSSRRGDFLKIIEEVRWELDIRGFQHVKIVASGNLNETAIRELNPMVDGYGVGTTISSASVIDFSLDIVEVEGTAIAKRGKPSGRKNLWRCPYCYRDRVTVRSAQGALCECGKAAELLTTHLIAEGEVVTPLPRPQEIRKFVLAQLSRVSL